MLKGCVQNLKREFADLVVGMAVFTGQISQLVLQYRQWCLIDNVSPNSLFAAQEELEIIPLSSRIPTSRCRFATADRPGQDRESHPAAGRAASGTRAGPHSRPRLQAQPRARP